MCIFQWLVWIWCLSKEKHSIYKRFPSPEGIRWNYVSTFVQTTSQHFFHISILSLLWYQNIFHLYKLAFQEKDRVLFSFYFRRIKLIVEIERQSIDSLCESRPKRQADSIYISPEVLSQSLVQSSNRIEKASVAIIIIVLRQNYSC